MRQGIESKRRVMVGCEELEARRLLTGYSLNVLADMDSNVGGGVDTALVRDSKGDLFGVTHGGSLASDGTLFELPAGTRTPVVLHAFGANDLPSAGAGLVMDAAGDIFGTTQNGGVNGDGSIYEVPAGGSFMTLYSFDTLATTGSVPVGTLALSEPAINSGNVHLGVDLYGMTSKGGMNGSGTIFQLTDAFSVSVQSLVSLPDSTGVFGTPGNGLARDGAGNLFGTAIYDDGTNDYGSVFEVPSGGGLILTVGSFSLNRSPGFAAAGPLYCDLATGNLFFTVSTGGDKLLGSIDELSGGTVTTVASLGSDESSVLPIYPYSSLLADAEGNLFGTSRQGGASELGAVFELRIGSHTVTTLGSFDVTNNGDLPQGGLVVDDDGDLFGATGVGGPNDDGAIYELTPSPATGLRFEQPQDGVTGQTLAPVAVDLVDDEGQIITTDNSTVTLTLEGTGGGTLGGTTTVAAVNGVATFSDLTVSAAGVYTLHATDGTRTAADTTLAVSVAHLSFAQQPSGVVAGAKISPSVAVDLINADLTLDATAKPTKVTLTTTDSGGKTLRFTAISKRGVATFRAVTFKRPGSYSLAASAGTFLRATSNLFSVAPAAAKKMVFTQPPVTVAHDTFFMVEAELLDQFGNIAINDDSTATIELVGGPKNAKLGGSGITSEEVLDGMVSISNLLIDPAFKRYRLRLTDGKLKVTSKVFAVT